MSEPITRKREIDYVLRFQFKMPFQVGAPEVCPMIEPFLHSYCSSSHGISGGNGHSASRIGVIASDETSNGTTGRKMEPLRKPSCDNSVPKLGSRLSRRAVQFVKESI